MSSSSHVADRRRIAVVLDFDGTLVLQDVGEILLDEFAPPEWRQEDARYNSGAITSKELAERGHGYLPTSKRDEMVEFARSSVVLRAGALDLASFCKANDVPLEVVSSGLDLYIAPFLRFFEIDGIPVSAKVADFDQGSFLVPTYPPDIEVCERLGVCKCSRVRHHQKNVYTVLFAGNGTSDQCVAGEADRAYARSSLAEYCDRVGIEYTLFESFDVVQNDLKAAVKASTDQRGSL